MEKVLLPRACSGIPPNFEKVEKDERAFCLVHLVLLAIQ